MSNLVVKADLIEGFNDELSILLEKAHRSGLSYYEILRSYSIILQELILMVDAEAWLNKK